MPRAELEELVAKWSTSGAPPGAHQPGEGHPPRHRDHQRRDRALLRHHGGCDPPPSPQPSGVFPEVSGRAGRAAVLHQEPAARDALLDPDRRHGPHGGQERAAGARTGSAVPHLGGEPGGGVSYAPVAGGHPRRRRPHGLRPRSGRARHDRGVLRRGALAARAAGGGRAARVRQDLGLQGAACPRALQPTPPRRCRRTPRAWPSRARLRCRGWSCTG